MTDAPRPAAAPRVLAGLTFNAFRQATRQPIYMVLVATHAVLILALPYVTFFGFGQEAFMVKEVGIATVQLGGLLVLIFAAVLVAHDELDSKTAVALLAKPVTRDQFVLSRYLALLCVAALTLVVLGGAYCLTMTNLPGDARVAAGGAAAAADEADEHAGHDHDDHAGHDHGTEVGAATVAATGGWTPSLAALTAVGLGMAVMAGVALLFAMRVPLAMTMLGTFAVFSAGNLAAYWSDRAADGVMGALAAGAYHVLPNFQHFNLSSAVARDAQLTTGEWWGYVGMAGMYAAVYSAALLLLATALFRRQEVA